MKTTSMFQSGLIRTVINLLLNKFFLAFILFIVWVSFFDRNSFLMQWKLSRTIHKLESRKIHLMKEIELTQKSSEDLNNHLEKYAREKYYMKKPGEKVFIIE